MKTNSRPTRHCLQRLRQYYPKLSSAQQNIAAYILQNPEEAVGVSVHRLATLCDTSPSTVVRLAKDIGFEGVKEMKIALAQEVGTLLPRLSADRNGDAQGVGHELLDTTIQGLQETANAVDPAVLTQAAKLITAARHVDIYGASNSYLVGLDLVEKLKKLGIYATSYDNDYMQAISSASLEEQDVAIAITYSGETTSVVENLGMAQERGARTIAITNFADSSVRQYSDLIITTGVSRHLVPDGSMSGRISQLFVVDLLFVELFNSDPERYRKAYRKYNEILLRKVSKARSKKEPESGDDSEGAGDGVQEEEAQVLKLVGGKYE